MIFSWPLWELFSARRQRDPHSAAPARRQLIHAPAEPAIERKPFNSGTFCSLFLSVHSAARPNFSSNVCADEFLKNATRRGGRFG